MENLEANFHEEMQSLYDRANNERNYNTDRFHQEVEKMGGVTVAREWLTSHTPRNGLYKLLNLSRLDICI